MSTTTTDNWTSASDAIDRIISMSIHEPVDTTETNKTDENNGNNNSRRSKVAEPSRFRTVESLKRFSWTNSNPELLVRAEMRIFDSLKCKYHCRSVSICNNTQQIWTIFSNTSSRNVPIVLLHGFAGGIGLWSLNLDQLSADRPVYAIDLPGFARSSRPVFSLDPLEAEQQFVDMIEQWRAAIGLNVPFIILGHSFGGFLSAAYAIRYPTYVKQLVLVDPWGFEEKPDDVWQHERLQKVPVWLRSISSVVMKFAPLAGLRAAGPLGVFVMKRVRSDLRLKFERLFNDDRVLEYLYQCNAQNPTGEEAFRTISDSLVWAKVPMLDRIDSIDARIPIYFLHGERSWIDYIPAVIIQSHRANVFVETLPSAGHHVYADAPDEFDAYLKRILINQI